MPDKVVELSKVIIAVKNHDDLLGLAKQFKRHLESLKQTKSPLYRQILLTLKQCEKH